MKNKKLFLRITSFIIVLFTVILIGRINSNAKPDGPKVYQNVYYTLNDKKLVNNKVSAVFCNLLYDENGNVNENLYKDYERQYTSTLIALYIDDSEEPYKKYEIPTELFLSFENSGHTVHKGISCFNGYETKCNNIYEFDLTGIEIKETFKIVFSWITVITAVGTNIKILDKNPQGCIYKFDSHTENDEIIIEKTSKDFYSEEGYREIIEIN